MGTFHRGVAGAAFVPPLILISIVVAALTSAGTVRDADLAGQYRDLRLDEILERCAAYCDRLSGAVLDFVCLESVEESIAPIVQSAPAVSAGGGGPVFYPGGYLVAGRKKRSVYVYDYQLVRDKLGEIIETRTLTLDNGRRVEEKNAPLKTRIFRHRYVVMGPLGLLARDRQPEFDYAVVAETSFMKERALVIKAAPRADSLGERLYGKVWVRKKDAAILKIEWQPESMGNYGQIEAFGKQLGMKPRLSFASEYGFQKNGIRFPSRYTVEESYTSKSWRPVLHSKTIVSYEAYKFFTVETGVNIK